MRCQYRAGVAFALMACGAVAVGGAGGVTKDGAEAAKAVKVKVFRHKSVSLTNAEADAALASMGNVLQTKDTSKDVTTPVTFVRDGSVQLLPANVAAVIQTQAQLNALFNAPSGVKIVRAINFCGGPGGSIIGCAPVGSPVVNIGAVRFTPALEGILWVHEYGHNCGLSHRTDDPNAVMFPSIGSTHRVVSLPESNRYRNGPAALTAGAAVAAEQPLPDPKDVKEFVRRHYPEGVPFEIAVKLRDQDKYKGAVETLLKMLDDPAEKEHLPEIVTTLCFIADEKAVEPLIKFVKSERSGADEFRAKNAVLIHLGDLIHKSKNKVALEYLQEMASKPSMVKKVAAPRAAAVMAANPKAVGDAAVIPPTEEELTAELSVSAAQGLALAGLQESEAALSALKESATALASVKEIADDAKKTSEKVRTFGQLKYYADRKKHEHNHEEKKP
ncbi:hypothetical protein GobsT_54160 [Gemmata obscuriglobus]|uniref:Peptidase M10 metallopeptidase domain-containing protein n=1 Tax=Gemmata obscuriglobus TaxID=114 RepID=A0A2Z3GZK7_9BACT|nr:hypothetical protein [Gemmata obscuriglobus]AWM36736.1 hypothetical protein C1280_06680 [Gemmata obscuriglobus]QEG30611.1 hypothetical protein GobsT_54160 [Gemmata obscuriglobus]VTS09935.1 hypothetical protein : Uncharacterized protein OS=Massilia sp. LC238 GN=FG94_01117 PE=4 SV=1 [Gemmata obscuriglobus UQM 2246]